MKRYYFFFILLFLFSLNLFAQAQETTILLVRHAEKATTPADDPILSPEGITRAEVLARMFENSGIKTIYATQYARTRLTAEPIAKKLHASLQTIDASSTNKLVQTILSKNSGETVLVVGHSNTLPEIVTALGVSNVQEIDDNDYDNLYVVSVSQKHAKLLRLKFFASPAEQVCQ